MKMTSLRAKGLFLLVAGFLLVPPEGSAHTPHDDVFDVAVARQADGTTRIFATVRGNLLRSSDEGRSWVRRMAGLTHRHPLSAVAVAPSDPDVVYVGSLGDGVFRSRDGGETWERTNWTASERHLLRIVVDPADPESALALTAEGRLFRTSDGGSNWGAALTDDMIVDQVAHAGEGTEGGVLLATSAAEIHTMPWSEGMFSPLLGLPAGTRITAMAPLPGTGPEPAILMATAAGRILVSEPEGSVREVWGGVSGQPVMDLLLRGGPGDQVRIVAVLHHDGPWCGSIDAGEWQACAAGTEMHHQAHDLGRPHFSRVIAAPSGSLSDRFLLAGFTGLYQSSDPDRGWEHRTTLPNSIVTGLSAARSAEGEEVLGLTTYLLGAYFSYDGGRSWGSANAGAMDYHRPVGYTRLFNIHLVPEPDGGMSAYTSTWYRWLERPSGSSAWQQFRVQDDAEWEADTHGIVASIAPDDAGGRVVLAGTHRGSLLKSTDGGRNFELLTTLPEAVNQVELSPGFSSDAIAFAGGVSGLFRTEDGGESWTRVLDLGRLDEPVPVSGSVHQELGGPEWSHQVAEENRRASLVWVALSPGFPDDGTLFAAGVDGVFRSVDGGSTFESLALTTAHPQTHARTLIDALAISPAYPEDGEILVQLRGVGLFRSNDRGDTFERVGTSLADRPLLVGNAYGFPVPVSPPIVPSPDYSSNGTLYAFGDLDLWVSRDRGDTWEILWTPAPDLAMRWTLLRRDATALWNAREGTPLALINRRSVMAMFVLTLLAGAAIVTRRTMRRRAS